MTLIKAVARPDRRLTIFLVVLMLALACAAWAGSKKTAESCNYDANETKAKKLLKALNCLAKVTVVSGGASSSPATADPLEGGGATAGTETVSRSLGGVVAEGDSISVFWGGSYTGLYAAAHPRVAFHGTAVGGARISDVSGGNGLEQRLSEDLALRPAVVTILIGANDLGDGNYASPNDWLAALWNYVAKVKATGAKVAVGTVLPQCESLSWQTETAKRLNQRRPAVNNAIRAAVGGKIDAVIDFAADLELGPDRAACDTRLYKDGLHPTDGGLNAVGGEGRMAVIYTAVLDRLVTAANAAAPADNVGSSKPSAGAASGMPATVTSPSSSVNAVAAIASNFDRLSLIVGGYVRNGSAIPPSAAPDDQGAFRFICSGGQLRYDDPILYPGQPGKAHLHQFYGNTLADANSTYGSLRTTGESTCSNKLNRSAYWVPAMMNAAGQVIQMDYASIYYKRNATGSALCKLVAAEGCFDLPTAFRAVSGYDMNKMGQAQPESAIHWRCLTNQIDRGTIKEALADCGGAGQIMGTVTFGMCWNGQLDSADHRSHIVQAKYIGQSYAQCPADHPRLIPTLTQQFAWTIARSDGEVYLSSDRMPGMAAMPGGTTLHADYMEAWDPTTRETWLRECIGKLLNCSDGELGDGTMLKRGTLTYTASVRLVAAPARPKS